MNARSHSIALAAGGGQDERLRVSSVNCLLGESVE